ncbi:MAG: glycosyltransferase family 2 protein [Chloroflexi bacterium]|nr:glycosyltransferase family 2 protein [Chloroflexota bacterium]
MAAGREGMVGMAGSESVASASVATSAPRAPNIVVAIPCHNEARNIGSLVIQAQRVATTVIVVDDGSAHDTAFIAERAGARVIRHEFTQGKDAALNSAFSAALKLDATALVLIDGDGQHRAADIPRIIVPVIDGEADIVVGSPQHNRESIPTVRRVGQDAIAMATPIGSGTHISDLQSGFRAFSRRAIESLTFSARGFAVESEMQFSARDRSLRVTEAPIDSIYEDPPRRNVFRHGLIVLDGLMRLVGMHRPLLFFAVCALISWLGGVVLAFLALEAVTRDRRRVVGVPARSRPARDLLVSNWRPRPSRSCSGLAGATSTPLGWMTRQPRVRCHVLPLHGTEFGGQVLPRCDATARHLPARRLPRRGGSRRDRPPAARPGRSARDRGRSNERPRPRGAESACR